MDNDIIKKFRIRMKRCGFTFLSIKKYLYDKNYYEIWYRYKNGEIQHTIRSLDEIQYLPIKVERYII